MWQAFKCKHTPQTVSSISYSVSSAEKKFWLNDYLVLALLMHIKISEFPFSYPQNVG